MLPKVKLEGIACPSALYFHNVEGDPAQKVLQSGPNADAVTVDTVEAHSLCSLVEPDNKGLLGHWAITFRRLVSKKGAVTGGIVNLNMPVEGLERVCWTVLPGPVDLFTGWARFRARKGEYFSVKTIAVNVVADTPARDVLTGVEGIETLQCELAHPGRSVEYSGETCKKCDVEGCRWVEFFFDERHHRYGDGFSFVLFDCGGGELGCTLQHCSHLFLMQDPGQTVECVPGSHAVNIVVNSLA